MVVESKSYQGESGDKRVWCIVIGGDFRNRGGVSFLDLGIITHGIRVVLSLMRYPAKEIDVLRSSLGKERPNDSCCSVATVKKNASVESLSRSTSLARKNFEGFQILAAEL